MLGKGGTEEVVLVVMEMKGRGDNSGSGFGGVGRKEGG